MDKSNDKIKLELTNEETDKVFTAEQLERLTANQITRNIKVFLENPDLIKYLSRNALYNLPSKTISSMLIHFTAEQLRRLPANRIMENIKVFLENPDLIQHLNEFELRLLPSKTIELMLIYFTPKQLEQLTANQIMGNIKVFLENPDLINKLDRAAGELAQPDAVEKPSILANREKLMARSAATQSTTLPDVIQRGDMQKI